ncbi:hypothetical protein K450DRAFT_273822 [Umbelopsis ramanniana AG]|uniref:RING-type domain-containing protein n=1 Tax=Umbelopsis ramanniana AG TaxID=1314678 RepID=A0AAD5E5Q8_UMBRA|nr:uncharacterized protein K450DRAFT_273822 [Umbelopsis ramanniana AG]KAI8577357.1 hypothetical protein K450DRAFT_273822 [Umbelopsis ramanniana AG]
MSQPIFRSRARASWNQLRASFNKTPSSSYIRFDSGVEETVIYKVEKIQWEHKNIPLLQNTIRKLIVENEDYQDEEFESALQLIRSSGSGTQKTCKNGIDDLFDNSRTLKTSQQISKKDDHNMVEFIMAFYLALHVNRQSEKTGNTTRQSRYICHSQEDNYFIFQFVSKSYQSRLSNADPTSRALMTKFEDSLPLIYNRNNITISNIRTLLGIEDALTQLNQYMDSQFQFLKECCDILQSSLLDEFMEKQHLVSKLNDTEKYLRNCEFETRQAMDKMLDHLKIAAAASLPPIVNFVCSKCHASMASPDQISYCLHTFCASCAENMRQTMALACPVCYQPLTDNGQLDKEAMKKFIDLYSSRHEKPSVNNAKINDFKTKCKRWTRKSLQLLSVPRMKNQGAPDATDRAVTGTVSGTSYEVGIATTSSKLLDSICII